MQLQIRSYNYKVDHRPVAKSGLIPRALMDTLMFEHGICYGQTVTNTEVQQQNTTQVQIREVVPPNHASPGTTVIARVSIEVPQQNKGVLIRGTFQHPKTPRRLSTQNCHLTHKRSKGAGKLLCHLPGKTPCTDSKLGG